MMTKKQMWKLFWKAMQVLLTVLTSTSITLILWNLSFSFRGYNAIGGEIVLAFLLSFVVWQVFGIVGKEHMEQAEEDKVTAVKIMCDGRVYTIRERK